MRSYRLIMRVAHYFNWHYAPPVYPERDMQLWCKWCGFRQTHSSSESACRASARTGPRLRLDTGANPVEDHRGKGSVRAAQGPPGPL
jgi:hypothetical protein